jgi:hypothetical protein
VGDPNEDPEEDPVEEPAEIDVDPEDVLDESDSDPTSTEE